MMAYYPVNPIVAKDDFIKQILKVRTNETLHLVNQQLAKLAETYDFHFINANKSLYDSDGNLKAEFTKEGMHMFANAYEIVFENIKRYI